jgi:hypothetical protein
MEILLDSVRWRYMSLVQDNMGGPDVHCLGHFCIYDFLNKKENSRYAEGFFSGKWSIPRITDHPGSWIYPINICGVAM